MKPLPVLKCDPKRTIDLGPAAGGMMRDPMKPRKPDDDLKDGQKAELNEKVVLINIGLEWRDGLTPEQLYERTRRYWHCNPDNHDAKYAVSVAKGVVREVYRIDGWDPVDLRTEVIDPTRLKRTPPPKTLDRWAFRGEVANEMQHYVGGNVSHYPKPGMANPLIWLNCEKGRRAGINN